MSINVLPEVVSREIVKPSTSIAHNHPAVHNLSFFDKPQCRVYVPLLFFYTSTDGETHQNYRSGLLKNSLSAALSHYYPLAGRIKDDVTVNCNDVGALFLEAHMECDLSEILKNPKDETLRILCPHSVSFKDSLKTGPVVVQITYFKCGGMSIGLGICHKTMDMASMGCFINEWASLAQKPDIEIISPEFNIGSLYPPLDLSFIVPTDPTPVDTKDLVWRRLVFNGPEIADLKGRVADQVPNPTRVEVVTSVIHKSAINAVARASSSGTLKSSVMTHAINLRGHVSPPLSPKNKGNMVGIFHVSTPKNEEVTLGWMVKEFGKSKSKFSNSCANASNGEEVCLLVLNNLKLNGEQEVYNCSSWCKNQLYETDFGWGKPLWVTPTLSKAKNAMCLMDTREGDGIEVHICLEDKVMAMFEQDKQLLSFCSINPSIICV